MPSDNAAKNTHETKKKWYKRGKVWAIIIITAAVVAGLSTYGWYLRRAGYTRQMVSEGWHEVALQADKTVVLLHKANDITTLGEASRELHALDGMVRDKQFYVSRVPSWLNDQALLASYTKFLREYGTYVALAASQSDDVTVLQSSDYSTLADAGSVAKLAANDLTQANTTLTEKMPSDIYEVAQTLEKIAQKADAAKKAEAKAKKDQQQQANKDELDVVTVEANISKFMDGFISADKEKMKRYMTEAYEKEFDFEQISTTSREYSYPASFRVTDNKKEGENYKTSINVIYKYRDTPSQYTSSIEYTVIYDKQYSTWLINSQRLVY